ncbi:MAG: chaperone NapD [Candidatus Hydrogenedentes bacterium]|nr:chaperone NapD [Candidatus Hydrogenedentota bacterium]
MPISGVILRTQPLTCPAVAQHCLLLPYITITHQQDDALVLVTDTPDARCERDIVGTLERIDGVVAVEVIYHNFEDLEGA